MSNPHIVLDTPQPIDSQIPGVLDAINTPDDFAQAALNAITYALGGTRHVSVYNNTGHLFLLEAVLGANAVLRRIVPRNSHVVVNLPFVVQSVVLTDLVYNRVATNESAVINRASNLDAQRNVDQYPYDNPVLARTNPPLPRYAPGGWVFISLCTQPIDSHVYPQPIISKKNYAVPYVESSGPNTVTFIASQTVTVQGAGYVQNANYWSGFVVINATGTACTVDVFPSESQNNSYTMTIPANTALSLDLEAVEYILHSTAIGQVFIPIQEVNMQLSAQ